jgi:hypothetical protein
LKGINISICQIHSSQIRSMSYCIMYYTGWPRSGHTPSVFHENLCSARVGSLSSDRLLVLVTLGWLVTIQSPCSAQLSFKHGCWSDSVYHWAEVGDSGLASWKTLLQRHHGDSESEILRPLWCWTTKESNNIGVGKMCFRNRQCERLSTRWPTDNEVGNMPHRGGISDAISCAIHSKKVCWALHSSIHHDGSHETWFKGKTFSSITRQWTERCWHECTERCMQLQHSIPTCPWCSTLHRWVCYLPECAFSIHCLLG